MYKYKEKNALLFYLLIYFIGTHMKNTQKLLFFSVF